MKNQKNQDKTVESEYFNGQACNESMQVYDYMSDKVYERINMLIKPDSRILELACGFGVHGKKLVEKSHTVIGVDISPKMVDIANKEKKHNFKAIVGDIENKRIFKRNSFDAVLCAGILHHFPNKNFGMLRENMDFWLKKQGVLVIIEPNGSNLVNKLSKSIGRIILALNPRTAICTENEQDNYSYCIYRDYFGRYFKMVHYSSFSPDKRVRHKGVLGLFTSIRWHLFRLNDMLPFPIRYNYLFLSFKRLT